MREPEVRVTGVNLFNHHDILVELSDGTAAVIPEEVILESLRRASVTVRDEEVSH